MYDLGDRVSVGWSGFASYDIDLSGSTCHVRVTVEADATDAAVAFVFSVLPLVLPVWALEPFHGSAVLTEAGALVVLGPSGAGKSSIAAALDGRGFPLLADDTCAFGEEFVLWPGPAAINPRWADALQAPVGEYNAKTIREPEHHSSLPVRPSAVVVLDVEDGAELEVRELDAGDRLRAILANARHGTFLLERRQALQFRVAIMLVRLPVALVRLDPSRHRPDEVIGSLHSWSEGVGVSTPGTVLEPSDPDRRP